MSSRLFTEVREARLCYYVTLTTIITTMGILALLPASIRVGSRKQRR